MKPVWYLLSVLVLGAACGAKAQPRQPAPLPRLGAELDATSVSGLSSGGYMAAQFQFAHGRIVVGAGIVAAGPYACVESADNPFVHFLGFKTAQAIQLCMSGRYLWMGMPDASGLARKAAGYAAENEIDPLETVAADRIYIFTGAMDDRVVSALSEVARDLYREIGVPDEQLAFSRDQISAAHAFVTEAAGAACGTPGSPFINDCDYDQAGAILTHIYTTLLPPAPASGKTPVAFDQTPFLEGLASHGLAVEGLVHIPQSCEQERGCRVHVVFHGCSQSREFVGDDFARLAGFNRWADANRLVILYPQTAKSNKNPLGCWDWWGYTGADYYAKKAPQITAVRRMLDHLAGPRQ